MGVSGDFRTAPGQQNIGVVALFFGDRAREIDKIQRLLKIRKTKDPVQMVVIDDLPFGYLRPQRRQFVAFQWRNSPRTRDTDFICQFHDPMIIQT